MKKSEELLRLEGDLNKQPELRKKLEAECKRIAEAGEAKCDGEVMVQAAAALGYSVTMEELERLAASAQELDPEEMKEAAGGEERLTDDWGFKLDEYGHNVMCLTAWHCYTVTLHTQSKYHDVVCWSDYDCAFVHKDWLRDYRWD